MVSYLESHPLIVLILFCYGMLLLLWFSAALVEKMTWKSAKWSFIICTIIVVGIAIRFGPTQKPQLESEIYDSQRAIPEPSPYNIDSNTDENYDYEEAGPEDCIPEFEFIQTPESSCFSRIGYCEDTYEMQLTFRTTGDYLYFGVPPEEWKGLVNADSKGNYFNANIKGNYDYERLG